MNPWRWVDPRVRSVRVEGLRGFLQNRGWTLVPGPNPNLLRFEARNLTVKIFALGFEGAELRADVVAVGGELGHAPGQDLAFDFELGQLLSEFGLRGFRCAEALGEVVAF